MVERSLRTRTQDDRHEVGEVLSRMVKALGQRYRPDSIILFGSNAYGTPTREGDIDLLIVKRTRKPFHERYAEVGGITRDVRRGWAASTFVISASELRERLPSGDQVLIEVMSGGEGAVWPRGDPSAG